MMKSLSFLLLPIVLLACTPSEIVDDVARRSAKSVVHPIVQDHFPGRHSEAITNCVIDNSTASEILSLARDAGTGPDAETVNTVLTIVRRPDTIRCVTRQGFALI